MFGQAKTKDVWQISAHDFPRVAPFGEQLKFLLNYAVLAPSSHNTQPWKFKIADNCVEIFADETRWLRVADADKREMFLSVGCALENLLIAAAHFGFQTAVEYLPDAGNENPAACVSFRVGNQKNDDARAGLFEFIPQRSTFHDEFLNAPVALDILREIDLCAVEPGVNLYLTESEEIRRRVDDLIARSDAEQFANPAFREELAFWIGQGAFGNSWLMSQIGKLAVAYLNLGKSAAKTDHKVLQSAPVMGLITSLCNDRAAQIKAGQVFERIYLAARRFNVGIRPMSQICQIPERKAELKNFVGLPNNHPQQPFLLGYAEFSETHTPRRSVEEVLMN